MTNEQITPTNDQKPSLVHTILSLIIPGLGQAVAGYVQRGISIFVTVAVLLGLGVYTVAQRARFPEYDTSLKIFGLVTIQAIVLLLLINLILQSPRWYKDGATRAFARYAVGIVYVIVLALVGPVFLELAGSAEELAAIHHLTTILGGGFLAALWVWQTQDAGIVAALPPGKKVASMVGAILIGLLVIISLGYNITGIDLPKAVSEFQDLGRILPRIFWPWEAAFEYEEIAFQSEQDIQAPCPEGAIGPPSNEPAAEGPWVSATPTCGEMIERDLVGNTTLGDEIIITGGGFEPGIEVEILWKNPIGNEFKPRGAGETEILIDETGGFETTLFIPQSTVPLSTATGDQIHQLVIRQQTDVIFTGNLSKEMNLALAAMLETIMIALMATMFGIVLAFPTSFLAARNLMAPIVQPFSEVVGGFLGILGGLWLSFTLTGLLTDAVGGLDQAPLLIFMVALLLMVALGVVGYGLGTRLFKGLNGVSEQLSLILSAVGLAALAAIAGRSIGLGFSRGIVSIPIGAEAAVATEATYALWFSVALGLIVLVQSLRTGVRGEVRIGMIVYGVVRTVLNIVRSIEPVIWAIVATIWVGLGAFAGTIALTLHTIAALAKLYSESIESIDPGPIEAIQATGANRMQTIIYAVVPQILPPFISFTIYRWDINVRMSTIIGVVGGGGIGFLVFQWMRLFQWEPVGIAMWLIAITVSVLDFVSSDIRERYV